MRPLERPRRIPASRAERGHGGSPRPEYRRSTTLVCWWPQQINRVGLRGTAPCGGLSPSPVPSWTSCLWLSGFGFPSWLVARPAAEVAYAESLVNDLPNARARSALLAQRLHGGVLDIPEPGNLLDDELGVHPTSRPRREILAARRPRHPWYSARCVATPRKPCARPTSRPSLSRTTARTRRAGVDPDPLASTMTFTGALSQRSTTAALLYIVVSLGRWQTRYLRC